MVSQINALSNSGTHTHDDCHQLKVPGSNSQASSFRAFDEFEGSMTPSSLCIASYHSFSTICYRNEQHLLMNAGLISLCAYHLPML